MTLGRSSLGRLPLLALLACSSPQQPFLGNYQVAITTNLTLPAGRRCPKGCTLDQQSEGPLAITAGPGSQLIFSYGQADGGRPCLITGTVQSATAFTLDQTGQGCQWADDAGATVDSVIESGSGTVDSAGDISVNESGTVTYTDTSGGLSVNGTFTQQATATRDGG